MKDAATQLRLHSTLNLKVNESFYSQCHTSSLTLQLFRCELKGFSDLVRKHIN